jgi:hypothetical protein
VLPLNSSDTLNIMMSTETMDEGLVREVSETYSIDKAYADKAHDNRRSFNYHYSKLVILSGF